jgi:hypothetical protein
MLEKACQWWPIWYLLFFCHGAEGVYRQYQTNEAVFPGCIDNNKQMKLCLFGCMANIKQMMLLIPCSDERFPKVELERLKYNWQHQLALKYLQVTFIISEKTE